MGVRKKISTEGVKYIIPIILEWESAIYQYLRCGWESSRGLMGLTVAFVLRNAVQTAPISWLYFRR